MRKFLPPPTQRFEPPVGIEDVVFGVVGGEGRPVSGVPSVVPVVPSSKPWPLPAPKACKLLLQQIVIGSEILIDQQRAAQRNNRNQICRNHLRVDVLLRRRDRAIDFVRLHGGEIEEQNDEAVIFDGLLCCRRRGVRIFCGSADVLWR